MSKSIYKVWEVASFDQACTQHGAASAMAISTVYIHWPAFSSLLHSPLASFHDLLHSEACKHSNDSLNGPSSFHVGRRRFQEENYAGSEGAIEACLARECIARGRSLAYLVSFPDNILIAVDLWQYCNSSANKLKLLPSQHLWKFSCAPYV